MAKIAYQLTLTVPRGPQASLAGTVDGDTYTKSDVTVPANGSKTVAIAGGAAAKIVLLLITAEPYSKDLSFKLDAADAKGFELTEPFAVVGTAAAHLLATDPNTLVFTNAGAKPAAVEILVARNASN